ncbi:MAG: LytTR family transcriptional regulator [Candidatus Marinimicrobia bacterium]|nr:LytTR family transcriptional regulator [FCB group bacterium]MBL7023962.1 LytTR family transcriptional regulator [Candidatus Neomarinimicrobiota bacterium]
MGTHRLKWINRPYPLVSRFRDQLLISISFGLFIFLFLRFFQPFGLGNMDVNKSLYVLGFGLITTLVMLANYTLTPRIIPGFFDADRWTVGKDILYGLWIIISIALFNYVYHGKVGGQSFEPSAILSFIIITASVGAFPLTIMVFINELYLNDRHQKNASKITQQIESGILAHQFETKQKKLIIGDSESDAMELEVEELIFVQASDNYVHVHYLENEKIATRLVRTTMKNIETQLSEFPDMKRCHRSYMVNRQKISKITGNARAYSIHFSMCDDRIPVSRGISRNSFFV